ncbi:MAG: ABC transporter ATP-binding protein [Bacteroidia bacterium]
MDKTVISVEHVAKSYVLRHQNTEQYTALRDVIVNGAKSLVKPRSAARTSKETFWALDDLSFEVKQGERLGVIGRNGAGKSTLLKVLSRIVTPTRGRITIDGRVASLLEVGTGFHPELSGRENIFLNGSILGMTRSEIRSKFDEIVAFSEVERFLDTPVKRYSSGMYVRLAFAVAAHLEPEILIVDEVLAVGDAEFQKKCMGKMKDVAGEGRTVIFVSHNMQAVSNLCSTGLLLNKGKTEIHGNVEDCIKRYMTSSRGLNLSGLSLEDRAGRTSLDVFFEEVKPLRNGEESWEFNYDEDITLRFKVKGNKNVEGLGFYIALRNPFSEEIIANFKSVVTEKSIAKDQELYFEVGLPKRTLRPGQYGLYFAISDPSFRIFYDVLDNNVNIPMLNINPVSMDAHENAGFVSLPFNLKRND